MILNDCVTEPVVVNTVSYFTVSAVIVIRASGLVMKDSFLQANKKTREIKISAPGAVFIPSKIIEETGISETHSKEKRC